MARSAPPRPAARRRPRPRSRLRGARRPPGSGRAAGRRCRCRRSRPRVADRAWGRRRPPRTTTIGLGTTPRHATAPAAAGSPPRCGRRGPRSHRRGTGTQAGATGIIPPCGSCDGLGLGYPPTVRSCRTVRHAERRWPARPGGYLTNRRVVRSAPAPRAMAVAATRRRARPTRETLPFVRCHPTSARSTLHEVRLAYGALDRYRTLLGAGWLAGPGRPGPAGGPARRRGRDPQGMVALRGP